MGRFPELQTSLSRDFRNSYNEGIKKVDTSLNKVEADSSSALAKAVTSENVSTEAKSIAKIAENKADSVQEQFNQVVIEGDSSVEAAQMRVDTEGVAHPTAKARVDSDYNKVNLHLEEKANQSEVQDILISDLNLVRNSDFEALPTIYSRSSVYSFLAGVTAPQKDGGKSLKIEALNYEDSTDVNKDFAFILTEKMMPREKVKVSFWVYPLTSNKTINIRMAYTPSVPVNLGPANQWNLIEIDLDLATMTQGSDYMYFNFNSSLSIYMSRLNVTNITEAIKPIPISLNRVSKQLEQNPTRVQNSNGIVERMIDIAQTYWDNVGSFVYGNRYTAYDPTMDLVGGKKEIDCSSFANLLIRGVPYEKSRYNGNSENVGSKLFFHDIDPYKYRYANQIGKYAYEKGYSFIPNEDFSNVEPGDILFFSWTNKEGSGDLAGSIRDNAFMKIDHVAAYLHKKNESLWATLQFDNGISTVYYEASNEYMSQCVLAARFPFANVESMYTGENIILDGDTVKNVTNVTAVGTYKLSKPLKKGRYYTFFIEGQVLTDNCYFVLQVNGKTIYSDNGKIGSYNGVTALRFPYLLDDIVDTVTLIIGAPTGTTSSRSANVNWCSLYDGYVRNKKHYSRSNTSGFGVTSNSLASNLDTLTISGQYYWSSTSTSAPSSSGGGTIIHLVGANNGWMTQIAMKDTTAVTWVRNKSNGVWSQWYPLASIIQGTSLPSTTPVFIGQVYIDTVNKVSYMAVGTSNANDWKQIT
ncbi:MULTISPECIES: pyocin knob domain-containing protein [unclassified Bacillus (in: firmicutes)]|uniref:pyocin knob domain-containing protein n=1 Tax=unclassified Bacillus (in: firmicutes) TaxID=185979 RepID=UPI001BE9424C|nr:MULTISPECIES: pyocin knob domain-containing protein [unclassified Bacillus (in: firmicutes)]MBT2614120.1 phage baseplate upper protein [Bacillus sp. ISL-78]MBT2629369.1 phage baseplate upper protein [Bacillus sp. ISL-101]